MTRLLEKKIFQCFCTPCQAVAALLGGPDATMTFKERFWVLAGGDWGQFPFQWVQFNLLTSYCKHL